MTLVDKLKNLHTTAVSRLHPQRVVFHHVPKCGGTSVGRALRMRYILSQTTILPDASFRALDAIAPHRGQEALLDFREKLLLYYLYSDVKCVAAHMRFSNVAYENFKSKYKFITIMRDPVSRFISNYKWDYKKFDRHSYIKESFDEFLLTERAKQMGSTYVQYFCGLQDVDFRSEEAIDAAIRNLGKFDVVGLLQDMNDFKRRVEHLLSIRLRIGHENKSPGVAHGTVDFEAPSLQSKVEELCGPDIAVWNRFARGPAAGHPNSPLGGDARR